MGPRRVLAATAGGCAPGGHAHRHRMTTPQVLNFYAVGKTVPPGAVYIGRGRGSRWGNPFELGRYGDRDTVIAKFRAWVAERPELIAAARQQLRGRDLVCFCAPRACHGDVWLEIANR